MFSQFNNISLVRRACVFSSSRNEFMKRAHLLKQLSNLSPCSFLCLRAGKPPVGLHLDVLKVDKLVQVSVVVMMFYICSLSLSNLSLVFIVLSRN